MSAAAHLSPATRYLDLAGGHGLESGERLSEVRVGYRTWGRLDRAGGNAVLVCHALTGSADADRWWGGLIGPGRAFDSSEDFIVCSNVLGSCYGTTGPTSRRPTDGRPWGSNFPAVTVRDMVGVQARLLDALGVRRLRLVIGGSLGGMQALEWAASFPDRMEAIVALATCGRHSAWCIGLSEAQRQAIRSDPKWRGGCYPEADPPVLGLAVARMMAMCTYRSRESFAVRFPTPTRRTGEFEVASYLRHQGEKLADRFDANCYLTLTRAMDTHDLGRGRGEYGAVLRSITAPALVVAIDSDVLYPPAEQEELARLLPHAHLARLPSPHGHDAFLTETSAVNTLVRLFRDEARAARIAV
ncbi:MAG: homoserine O-acetyltransferase [Thermoanaerobaculales bacterium]